MTELYENTSALSGISNKAIEMDNMDLPEENHYETQAERYETLQVKRKVSQRQAEPGSEMEDKSSTSHRKSVGSLKVSSVQCSIVILALMTISISIGVLVYGLKRGDMKDMQLEIESRLSTFSSALSSLNGSFQDQTILFEKEISRIDDRLTSISAFTATKPANHSRRFQRKFFIWTRYTYMLNFSMTIFNLGEDFNSFSGVFTCKQPGTYYFSVFLVKKRDTVGIDQVYCYLCKNSSKIIYIEVNPTDDDTDKGSAQAANSAVIHLNVGDTVSLQYCTSASSMEDWSSFSGFLIYPDA